MKRALALLLVALLLLTLAPSALAEDAPSDNPPLPTLSAVQVDKGIIAPAFDPNIFSYTVQPVFNPESKAYSYSVEFLSDSEEKWLLTVKRAGYDPTTYEFGKNTSFATSYFGQLDASLTVQSLVEGGHTYTFTIVYATPAEPTPEPEGTVYYPDYDEAETESAEAPQGGKIAEYLVVCRSLNVRSTPSTALPRIGSLRRGDVVQVLALENDWARIVWEDEIAYVHTDYLVLAPEQR